MRGGLAVTALVLFSSLSLAGGARIEGSLQFTRALHEGAVDARFPTEAAYGNGSSSHPLAFSGAGHADRIVVNWTSSNQVGAGSAQNEPNASIVSTSTGKAETGEVIYTGEDWSVRSVQPDGNWLLTFNGTRPASLLSLVGNATLTASPNVTWFGGSHASTASGGGKEWQRLTVKHLIPAGVPILETGSTVRWDMDGSFTLYLWGVNITVGDDTYRSGQWTTTAAGDAFGPRGVARVERTQLLRVRVEGTLAASSDAAGMGWTGDTIDIRTLGRIAMEGSTGDLRIDGLLERHEDDRVAIEGNLTSAVRTGENPSVLEMDIRSDDILATPPPVTPFPPDGAIQPKASDGRVTDAFGAVAVASFAGVAVFAIARRRSDTRAVAAAERALLAGRPRKAIHLLRGRLRRHEDDVDAWFLHGAAVLQEDGPRALVRSLEPVARRIAPPRRFPLSFLLAISLARLDDRRAAIEWLRDASQDPLYRSRARHDPMFSSFVLEAGFLNDETPAYA